MLRDGDHARDARGLPAPVEGTDELVQRAMIRLTARRGGFALDPELGSDFFTLGALPARELDDAALALARQALLPLAGVEAEAASCSREGGRLTLRLTLAVRGETKRVEVRTGG